MEIIKWKIWLLLIVSLAGALRFYRLGSNPPSLDWDEVSLGYNAWALSETGHDEFGNSWPLSIRSFGDYKPPVYTYLLIPVLKVMGRSDLAVRFPSAVAGILTVWLTYFLTAGLLSGKSKVKSQKLKVEKPALVASFLLAISPWHIQFSRIAFEANVGLFFMVGGLVLLLRWLNDNSAWSLPGSALMMSLAMMSYHSPRVVVPLLVVSILIIYRKDTWKQVRNHMGAAAAAGLITGATLILIGYTLFFQGVGQSRLSETSLLTIDELTLVSQSRIAQSGGNLLDRVVNHRYLVYGKQFMRGYLDHFDLRFWFLDGDNINRHRALAVGLLYWWELPFLTAGMIALITDYRLPITPKGRLVLLIWLLSAPAASAMTGGTPSAVRSLTFLPVLQIIEGIGLIWGFNRIRRKLFTAFGLFLVTCFLLLVTFEFSHYLHQYFVQAPVEFAPWWQYGYHQLVERVEGQKDQYDRVIITTAYDQPYIYFLWYGDYDPKKWVNDGEFNKRFDSFEFKGIERSDLQERENTLLVGSPWEIPEQEWDWMINYPDGSPVFVGAEPKI